ncbi:MAG: HTH domain-containing protein [Clostridia bacterium]|nr:HTH domain-containing protein [Clostridia bacterium]
MSVSERRAEIIEILCRRRYDTRSNLAFELGVSKRTIELDIAALSLDYPIYTQQGNGGGIYVVEGFYLHRRFMSTKQVQTLNLQGEQIMISTKQINQELRDIRYYYSK